METRHFQRFTVSRLQGSLSPEAANLLLPPSFGCTSKGLTRTNIHNCCNQFVGVVGWQSLGSIVRSLRRLRPGFYQTGRTSAVECNILLLDGSSVCEGGSPCLAARVGLPAPESCHGTFGALLYQRTWILKPNLLVTCLPSDIK